MVPVPGVGGDVHHAVLFGLLHGDGGEVACNGVIRLPGAAHQVQRDHGELAGGAGLERQDPIAVRAPASGGAKRFPGSLKIRKKTFERVTHLHHGQEEYPFLAEEEILAACRRDEAAGAHRFSIVTAGRSLKGEDLELALSAYRRLRRETGVKLCASHGLQTREEFERMKAAGVDRCHINLETSRRYFPHICTTTPIRTR